MSGGALGERSREHGGSNAKPAAAASRQRRSIRRSSRQRDQARWRAERVRSALALRCGEQRADLGVEDAAREDAVVEVGAAVEGFAVVHHEVVAA